MVQRQESDFHGRWRENGSVPHLFPYALEIVQPDNTRKDTAADGTLRTLSRIDRARINVHIADARDFHCHFHVTDNSGEWSIPSDHEAIRVVILKPLVQCGTGRAYRIGCRNIPFSAPFLKQISDGHQSVLRRSFLPLLLTSCRSLGSPGFGLVISFFATHRAARRANS